MHFINAQKDQAGTYVCKAENSQGAALKYVEVSVLANPTFLEKPENQTLSAGSRLTLNGSFVGSDGENELKISWYLNNALVQRRTVPDRRVRIVGNQDQSLWFIEYSCLTPSLVDRFSLQFELNSKPENQFLMPSQNLRMTWKIKNSNY